MQESQAVLTKAERVAEKNPCLREQEDSIKSFLSLPEPFQDRVTKVLDGLSDDERSLIYEAIGPGDCFGEEYKQSRRKWFEDATYFRGRKLTPEEGISEAKRHRLHYIALHPKDREEHPHSDKEKEILGLYLWRIISSLGSEICRRLGYSFS